MKFWKVKPEYDQAKKGVRGGILIANELYSKAEREKLYLIPERCFEVVELDARQTYKAFGARFEKEN